jgi:predicted NUDIX family NTP pyrophosphohydrolase
MIKTSYGILLYKQKNGKFYVLLAHPGGPFWESKDLWTIPKGEPDSSDDNDVFATAKREFSEETGLRPPIKNTKFIDLGELPQSNMKINHIFAVEGDPDLNRFTSNTFDMEWPPQSGIMQTFVEIDRIAWFDADSAKNKLFPKQQGFITRLEHALKDH